MVRSSVLPGTASILSRFASGLLSATQRMTFARAANVIDNFYVNVYYSVY